MFHYLESYLFLAKLNLEIKKKIIRNKIKNLIYYNFSNYNYINIKNVRQWCKTNRIKFYIADDIKLAIKLKTDGIYLTRQYKTKKKLFLVKKQFTILGSAHNQMEYCLKKSQGCKRIFLSPIFKTNKYSINKVLGLVKFNLISLDWNIKTVALGGVNKKNFKFAKLTKNNSIGFQSLINEI
jgi:thiamine-phosphate pyrophosphorylase